MLLCPVKPVEDLTVLVTGATDGLGRLVAERLAGAGAAVLLHGRDRGRGERAVEEIRRATGNERLRYFNADFSSLDEVRRLTEEIVAAEEHLDVLISNAGIGAGAREGRERESSRDGYELRFQVNYLAGFLLVRLLLPLLRRSAPARIVNVSSAGQSPVDLGDVMLERRYDGMHAYRQSKLAQVMFTLELAERLDPAEVTVNALHPASLMNTKMVLEWFGSARTTVEEGAEATLRLATSPELDGVTGRYFDGLRESLAHAQAYDAEARRRLWELSEELVGVGALSDSAQR
jgi:NAD(P)-dependent dehydrogenase (short-subunit alcohol dehydrogenase family)